jgi:GalNAc-alpha-(1->4)-GalNAc-alpha-(1->3)-diNAcBac-PP-undecaprenol alpha-1,4-N-acetyl-D-galactosaminyltransferase
MKILFIISSLDVGGAEKILTTLANHFDNMGHSVTIVITSSNRPYFALNRGINLISIANRVNNILFLINSLRKEIISNNPDAVISFMSEMNILALIASKLADKPIIVSERSAFDFLDIKPRWKKIRRMVYPFVNSLVVLTDADKNRYYFVKHRYKIENPLILKNNHTNIKREKIILAVGRLNRVKGFDLLIEAFSKFNRDNWKLLIAGEGKERKSLERLIDTLELSNRVKLLGLVKDVEIYYKKASIFVLSSLTEGFPGVLCEAMGYGCAVISFDCPSAPREIITANKDGILIESKNIKELTNAMHYLVDNPKVREKLSKNAREISNRLSIDKIGDKWLKVINSVVRR